MLKYPPMFFTLVLKQIFGFFCCCLFVLFFFYSLSLDYHGNVDTYTSEAVVKVSARGTYRIVCPLGIFCDSFVNADFLV